MKFLKKFKKLRISRQQLAIIAIVLVGACLRFYNLSWGLPYPFHPDERNMAEAITRFSSENLDPGFYAYGQFPLYLAYFSAKLFFNLIRGQTIERLPFNQAILALRLWSAFFSTATIYLCYLIFKKSLFKFEPLNAQIFKFLGIFSPLFVAFSPGLIQAAHFGTTESILTFCYLASLYFSLAILENLSFKNYFWAALFLGIALGSKISAVVFAFPIFLVSCKWFLQADSVRDKLKIVFWGILFVFFSLVFTLISSPFLILNFKQSQRTLLYEISVAQGLSLPFYTRQFIKTTPVLFQFQKIFPYALGWPIFIFGLAGAILIFAGIFKKILKRSRLLFTDFCLLVMVLSFLTYFSSQAFLFAKWTRFMAPILPFFSIFATYFLSKLMSLGKKLFAGYWLMAAGISIIPGLIFSSIYFKPDIRFTASSWIYQNLPSGSHLLSETANVVDIPILFPGQKSAVNHYQLSPVSFNFYDLDESPKMFERLLDELVTSDYILIPSRRLFANHLRLPEKYPLASQYYQLLFSGQLGFKEIKTFYPFLDFKINNWSLRIDDEQSEETFTVFDHPVIRIYKKDIPRSRNHYESLFKVQ